MSIQEKIRTMPGLDTQEVARLFDFRGDPYLVLSLYMDADARRQDAIGDALARGGQVELLEEPGELRGDGGMGSLLRFRPERPRPEEASPEIRARMGER